MTRLDRASCLTYDGDASNGLAYAIETLTLLTQAQRQGIIALRGFEILNALPRAQQALPAAQEFRELLMLTTESVIQNAFPGKRAIRSAMVLTCGDAHSVKISQ